MSILNVFESPSFLVESITVRFFDNWPDPRSEIRDSMEYENVVVKPVDVPLVVKELVERIRNHDYRSFNYSEVTAANKDSKPNALGIKRMKNVAVVRFAAPEKGKPDRIKHIGVSFSYAVEVETPKKEKKAKA